MIVLEELIKVDAQKLKDQTKMFSPEEAVPHADNVVFIIRIHPPVQKLQDTHFHSRLRSKLCWNKAGIIEGITAVTKLLQCEELRRGSRRPQTQRLDRTSPTISTDQTHDHKDYKLQGRLCILG